MNYNKIIIFLSLVLSSYSIERRHHCSSITCGRDCNGDCGWSSFWNRCLQGYTTTRDELNSGRGCTTTSSTLSSTITSHLIYIINNTIPTIIPILTTSSTITSTPTSTLSSTMTSTLSSTMTSTITTNPIITSQIINISENEQNSNSYAYIAGILVPLFFLVAIILIYKKLREKRDIVVINDRREYLNRMYNEHTVYDEIYEEPVNSIIPYAISDNNDVFYDEPVVRGENNYEYDNKVRAWENKKYEM